MDRPPPLTAIYFNPTQDCNLRCLHCWVSPDHVKDPDAYAARHQGDNEEMSPAVFDRLVAEAKPLGLGRVKFTGGEPFLRKELVAFMEVLHGHAIHFEVETNGTLVQAKQARAMKRLGCTQVAVSLDGSTPSFHDRFRGVKGCHRRAVRGIQRLLSAGLNVQVILSLMEANEDELEPTMDLASRLGVHSFKVNPVTPSGRGRAMLDKGRGLPASRLIELLPHAEKVLSKRYGLPVCFSLPLTFQDFDVIKSDRFGRCNILNIMGILGDGSISICGIGKEEPDLVVGRYPAVSVAEAWREGKVFLDLRKRLPDGLKGVCGDCILRGVCLGYCRANAYHLDKDLMAPYWFCREAREAGQLKGSRVLGGEATQSGVPS